MINNEFLMITLFLLSGCVIGMGTFVILHMLRGTPKKYFWKRVLNSKLTKQEQIELFEHRLSFWMKRNRPLFSESVPLIDVMLLLSEREKTSNDLNSMIDIDMLLCGHSTVPDIYKQKYLNDVISFIAEQRIIKGYQDGFVLECDRIINNENLQNNNEQD